MKHKIITSSIVGTLTLITTCLVVATAAVLSGAV